MLLFKLKISRAYFFMKCVFFIMISIKKQLVTFSTVAVKWKVVKKMA